MHRRSLADDKIVDMRRIAQILAIAFVLVATCAGPVAAHTAFDPDEAAPGAVITVTLNAADERDGAAMTKVELFLPENVEVPVSDPATGAMGWTATTNADAVVWEGPPTDGDQSFAVTLGPLPADPQRLQFKVLQTYDNGDIDRWIEEHPAGAAEPGMPGPVIDLVAGGPGTIPEPTTSTAPPPVPDPTVVALDDPTTTTAAGDDSTDVAASDAADGDDDDDDDSVLLPVVIAIVIGAVVLGGGGYALARRR